MPRNLGVVVGALRACHTMLTQDVLAKTVAFGPTYRLALAASDAIAKLADHLTGRDGYFTAQGSAHDPGARQRHGDRMTWERGEKARRE